MPSATILNNKFKATYGHYVSSACLEYGGAVYLDSLDCVPPPSQLAELGICEPEDAVTWKTAYSGWDGYINGRRALYIRY